MLWLTRYLKRWRTSLTAEIIYSRKLKILSKNCFQISHPCNVICISRDISHSGQPAIGVLVFLLLTLSRLQKWILKVKQVGETLTYVIPPPPPPERLSVNLNSKTYKTYQFPQYQTLSHHWIKRKNQLNNGNTSLFFGRDNNYVQPSFWRQKFVCKKLKSLPFS